MVRWIRHLFELALCAWRLRPHLRGGRWLYVGTLSAAIVAAFFEMMGVALLTQVIALLQVPAGVAPGSSVGSGKVNFLRWIEAIIPSKSPAFYVTWFCVCVVVVMATKNLLLLLSTQLGIKLRIRMTLNLRLALFHRLQHADLALFERKKSGEIASVFYQEINRVALSMEYFVLLAQRAFLATFSLAWLVFLSWELTFMGLALATVIGVVITGFQRRLRRAGGELASAHQKFGGRLSESIGGTRIIRALHAQDREEARFEDTSSALCAIEARTARISSLIPPIAETIGVMGAMIIVAIAYSRLIQGGELDPAFLFAFGMVISRLLPMLNQMASLSGALFVTGEGFREVEWWLGTTRFPVRKFGSREFRGVTGEIRFENVSYTYPNGNQVLDAIHLVLPAGKTVALVGESGSGKSTLATLLLRLREPTTGRISVDEEDYWEFSPDSWHRKTGVVEQEAFLFNDTIEGNILFGRDIDSAQVGKAIRIAHLEDVIRTLPQGLQTQVGERGTMLSGGQKQRLAIARAIVSDPKLLILDEATSALDSVSERMVQSALDSARHGRTVLVIAHRLSTIRNADRIVVLQQGRIVEQGSWAELNARKGVFSHLARSDEFVAEAVSG